MADRVRVLTVEDRAWDGVVESCPSDFYHGRAYHRLAQHQGEGEARLAVFGGGDRFLAWPYLLRPTGSQGHVDATAVYGYAGPVGAGLDCGDGRDRAAFLNQAWLALRGHWGQEGVVSVFTRFNPLLANARLAETFTGDAAGPDPALSVLGRSVSMDLTLASEERLQRYDKESRYEIRRAARHGLEVEVDPGFEHLDALVALYRETMVRNGADERYLFDRAYFRELVATVGPAARLVVARVDDDVAGGLLVVCHGRFAHAHLTGVADAHLRHSPLKSLLHRAADEARSDGALWLHLGAGRGGAEDSLFDFKRRMAPVEHRFVVGRWVLDGARYAALTGDRPVSPSFFPAYRAPDPAPLP